MLSETHAKNKSFVVSTITCKIVSLVFFFSRKGERDHLLFWQICFTYLMVNIRVCLSSVPNCPPFKHVAWVCCSSRLYRSVNITHILLILGRRWPRWCARTNRTGKSILHCYFYRAYYALSAIFGYSCNLIYSAQIALFYLLNRIIFFWSIKIQNRVSWRGW